MTEKSAVLRVIRDVRHDLAPDTFGPEKHRPHVRNAEPKSRVLLLRGRFRGAEYIKRHVSYVVAMDADRGEQHVQRNLDAIRRRLDEMGIDRDDANREIRSIESAVRAEIWRQTLLP